MGRATRKKENGLGAKMRVARLAHGLGLRDLAVQVGMSPSSLSEFENGKSVPGQVRLEALAAVLGVALAEPAQEPEAASFTHWRTFDPIQLDAVRSAALDVFVDRGYHGATVRMIADRCGMSVAGVYHHVSSKDDLLDSLLQRAMGELVARCRAADAESDHPRERLTNLVECLVLFHVHRRSWAFLAASEVRTADGERSDRLIESRRDVRRMMQDAIASYRGPDAAAISEESTARAIATMCVGVADWYAAAVDLDPGVLARDYALLAIAMAEAGSAPTA